MHLTMHAAASGLLAELVRDAAADYRPIWVEKSAKWPDVYARIVVSDLLRNSTNPASCGILTAYVPLTVMKQGRVRAALAALADRLVPGQAFPSVLGRYAGRLLADPDESLAEWEALSQYDIGGLLKGLEEDPVAAIAEAYGSHLSVRVDAEDLELLMRTTVARQSRLDVDPEASAETDETDESIEGDAAVISGMPSGLAEKALQQEAVAEAREATEHSGLPQAVAAYVEAHTREHLSPVVARALTAYRIQGSSAATQELKVTKAPRKTLGAVSRLAGNVYDGVALIFDQFDRWDDISQDIRLKLAGALSEMRWSMDGIGIVVIMSRAGQTPELEEQFAAATRLPWDFEGLEQVNKAEATVDDAPLNHWFSAATICPPAVAADDPVLRQIADRTEGDLERFVAMAVPVIDEAMARGSATLDASAIPDGSDAGDAQD